MKPELDEHTRALLRLIVLAKMSRLRRLKSRFRPIRHRYW